MAFAPLLLPPYVLLEVFDWLPTMSPVDGLDANDSCMHLVSHIKKIRVIEGFQRSLQALLVARRLALLDLTN